MRKIASITLYILAAVSFIILISYIISGANSEGGLAASKYTGHFIAWGVIMLGMAVLLLLGFTVASMIENPKMLLRSLAIIGATAVLFFISYYFSSTTPLIGKNADVSPVLLKWVGTGLNVTYVLGIFALLTVVFTEIYRAFR